jgi:hypothetical protein
MARPTKTGLNYFPLDVDFWSDDKIERLRFKHSSQGVLFYVEMLSRIYRVGICYKWDDSLFEILSSKIGASEEQSREILNYCLKVGLFSSEVFEKTGYITSRGIQKRYIEVLGLTRRSLPDFPEGVILINKINETKVKERKVKETEETRVNPSLFGVNPSLSEETPHALPQNHPSSTNNLIFSEDDFAALEMNVYFGDTQSLHSDITAADAYCRSQGKFYGVGRAKAYIESWKRRKPQFEASRARGQTKAERIREKDDANMAEIKRQFGIK